MLSMNVRLQTIQSPQKLLSIVVILSLLKWALQFFCEVNQACNSIIVMGVLEAVRFFQVHQVIQLSGPQWSNISFSKSNRSSFVTSRNPSHHLNTFDLHKMTNFIAEAYRLNISFRSMLRRCKEFAEYVINPPDQSCRPGRPIIGFPPTKPADKPAWHWLVANVESKQNHIILLQREINSQISRHGKLNSR